MGYIDSERSRSGFVWFGRKHNKELLKILLLIGALTLLIVSAAINMYFLLPVPFGRTPLTDDLSELERFLIAVPPGTLTSEIGEKLPDLRIDRVGETSDIVAMYANQYDCYPEPQVIPSKKAFAGWLGAGGDVYIIYVQEDDRVKAVYFGGT